MTTDDAKAPCECVGCDRPRAEDSHMCSEHVKYWAETDPELCQVMGCVEPRAEGEGYMCQTHLDGGAAKAEYARIELEERFGGGSPNCSFCGKGPDECGAIVKANPPRRARICETCIVVASGEVLNLAVSLLTAAREAAELAKAAKAEGAAEPVEDMAKFLGDMVSSTRTEADRKFFAVHGEWP